MKPNPDLTLYAPEIERRHDGPAKTIDEAVVLASVDGVGPALEHMAEAGVPHETALRVLTSPTYHRRPSTSAFKSVVDFISERPRRRTGTL